MKPKLNLIALTIMLFFSITSIKAQTTTSSFTPSHLQAAQNFLVATGIDLQFGKITDNIINVFSKQVPEAQRPAFITVMQKFMGKYYNWDSIKGKLSEIYANEFSEDELDQLITFYSTPVGKKFGEKSASLAQKGMLMGQQIITEHQAELQQMMKDAMPASKTN